MTRTITIDPVTRLEGHGKISLFLDDAGEVSRTLLQIPELRGFEAFCVGRPAEQMPQITSRICGVCPTAHHMAATRALDDLYQVTPTAPARIVRDLFYSLFTFEDHALHFYFLGGPDFVVGPDAPKAERNVLGVIGKVGVEVGKQVIAMRRRIRELMADLGGKPIHPVLGLPGGVAKPIAEDQRKRIAELGKDAIDFAQFSLNLFHQAVLGKSEYVKLIVGDVYYHQTYYMGLVDDANRLDLCGQHVRVVKPDGKQHALFPVQQYAEHIAERVEPWSYMKYPYLKNPGWNGFVDGADSGVYRVGPLARINVADSMKTPLAQAEYTRLFETIGRKPCHHTLATHWARLIEMLHVAEYISELAQLAELTSSNVRNLDLHLSEEGIGVVEAPRGTLIHHYTTDERGILTGCNLIVATVGNAAALNMSVDQAAKKLISKGVVNDGLLNLVEMAYRAYDPCMSCATHALPGEIPLAIDIFSPNGELLRQLTRR